MIYLTQKRSAAILSEGSDSRSSLALPPFIGYGTPRTLGFERGGRGVLLAAPWKVAPTGEAITRRPSRT